VRRVKHQPGRNTGHGDVNLMSSRRINMHAHRKLRTVGFGLLLAAVPLAGCGPIVFSDGGALAITGTAPPPPEAEPPPPEPEKRVEVRDNKIVINEKVQFEFDSAKILPVSHDLLNEVAQVIKDNPQIKKIEVEGHASSEGSENHNLKLSDRRAKAVMKYLTSSAGVDKGMLSAKGYGVARPIASNDTDDGREKNRRVEFTITEQEVVQTKVEIDPATGKEKVVDTKKVSG
jgi:outer membrane protein OmpA-like peptidoglycan-associated protein